jgi:superfamily II DNA or RNA helicase
MSSTIERLQDMCQLSVRSYDMRTSQYVIKTEQFWTIKNNHVVFPRYLVVSDLDPYEDRHDPADQHTRPLRFQGTLRSGLDQQDQASASMVKQLKQCGGGILCMPPGRGKTVTACHILAEMGVSAVVLVHTHELVVQWLERLPQFLPGCRLAEYKNQQVKPLGNYEQVDIVVATLQTMCLAHTKVLDNVGLVLVDEAHHICASSLRLALEKFNARYTLGLTATPDRKDQRTSFLYWALGPLGFNLQVPYDLPVQVLSMQHGDPELGTNSFKVVESRLAQDAYRVYQILDRAFEWLSKSQLSERNVLILATRLDVVSFAYQHLVEVIAPKYLLDPKTIYRLDAGKQNTIAKLKGKILLSSDKLVNEGFDVARLDTLIRLMPTNEVKQTVGRIMRSCPGKILPVCVVEVDDHDSPMLHNMWRKRVNHIQYGTRMSTGKYQPFTTGTVTLQNFVLEPSSLGPMTLKKKYGGWSRKS